MILVVIPAKGASRRLPGKNMTLLDGKPLVQYAIEEARNSRRVDRIVVSTDDDEIAAYASSQGIEVVRRPESLGGDVPLFDVYRHAAMAIGLDQIDVLIGLQVDHPDRNVRVDDALEKFEQENADFLCSTEANGTKNGAYKIYNRKMLKTGTSDKEVVLIDDCTNIHYAADLERAARVLRARGIS